MTMRIRQSVLAIGLLLGGMQAAHAHAQLRSATPPVGGTVRAAPAEVAINFSEGVEPRFSSIEVRDEAGARVDRGGVHVAPGVQTRLIVGLQTLKPGRYAVRWSAISVDTHHTEGSFAFTVAAP
jgi:methionine-rich copper-binding protein CopC